MTALNKQALREAAQEEIMLRSVSDTSDAWQDEASPGAVLALLDELEAAQHGKDELQQGFIANQEEAHEAIKYATELKEQLARAFSGREGAFREVDEMQKSLDHTHRLRAIWRVRAEVAEYNLEAAENRIAKLEALTAGMEQELVAYMTYKGYLLHAADPKLAEYSEPMPLYAATQLPQPAPVSVPAAMEMDDDFDSAFEHGKAVGWNACRAVMLRAANSPVTPDDVLRMDWLVSKTVDVREPMVYGSHSIFWSQTITDEDDDYHATKLREQIDAAMAAEQAAAPQQEVKSALEHGMQRYAGAMQKLSEGDK
ncbi:TPA: hypothetical protein ACOJA7_002249 [Citrobacter freundii]